MTKLTDILKKIKAHLTTQAPLSLWVLYILWAGAIFDIIRGILGK